MENILRLRSHLKRMKFKLLKKSIAILNSKLKNIKIALRDEKKNHIRANLMSLKAHISKELSMYYSQLNLMNDKIISHIYKFNEDLIYEIEYMDSNLFPTFRKLMQLEPQKVVITYDERYDRLFLYLVNKISYYDRNTCVIDYYSNITDMASITQKKLINIENDKTVVMSISLFIQVFFNNKDNSFKKQEFLRMLDMFLFKAPSIAIQKKLTEEAFKIFTINHYKV